MLLAIRMPMAQAKAIMSFVERTLPRYGNDVYMALSYASLY
jgi:hypothetical protein